MNPKSLIFSASLTEAVRAGRKDRTRRLMKGHREDAPRRVPGDILYIPEAWKCRKPPNPGTLGYEVVFRDGGISKFCFTDKERWKKWVKYWDKPDMQWQSPYFMPREAARLFVQVTDVGLERLQDMREEDYIRDFDISEEALHATRPGVLARGVWNSTVKPKDLALFGWDANPWVEVIYFEKISVEEAMRYIEQHD